MLGFTVTSLIGFLTAIIALGAGAVVLFRQVVGAYGDRLENLKERASELGAEKDELQRVVATQLEELRSLHDRPDWEGVLKLAHEMSERSERAAERLQAEILTRLDQAFVTHEQRVQERHEGQMEINQSVLRALSRIMGDVRRNG